GNVLIDEYEVGSGFGEFDIVTQCSPAMKALDKADMVPVDAVVVGIVDNLELSDDDAGKKK
ncbi:MAG: EutN/CcmL family microcompartment protein, partial [Deltaproteobacteria bacterium]